MYNTNISCVCLSVCLSVCSISGRVLVYGSSLSAYCCVRYLLEQVGLAGERISLVLPHTAACFNNPEVEKQVQKAIATSGEGLSIIHNLIPILCAYLPTFPKTFPGLASFNYIHDNYWLINELLLKFTSLCVKIEQELKQEGVIFDSI